jgi:hypothetical protein
VAELEAQLTAANAQVAAQAEQIAELEGQDNSDCSGGILSQFLVEDCPPDLVFVRSVAREGSPFDDDQCQMFADDLGRELQHVAMAAYDVQRITDRIAEGLADPRDLGSRMEWFGIMLSDYFRRGGPIATEWMSYCELECPE